MSVVSVRDNYMEGQWSASQAEDGTLTFTTSHLVEVSTVADGPAVVLSSGSVPQINNAYLFGNDVNLRAFCISRSCERVKDGWFSVTATWSTKTEKPRDEEGNPSDDPTQWRTVWELGFSSRQKEVTNTIWVENTNGTALAARSGGIWAGAAVNSANVPVKPPPLMDDSRLHFRATFHEKEPDYEMYTRYRNAVNSDTFFVGQIDIKEPFDTLWMMTIQPRTAKILNISSVEAVLYEELYFKTTIEFMIDEDGWLIELTDEGMSARACSALDENWFEGFDVDAMGQAMTEDNFVTGTSRTRQLFGPDGIAISEPALLDGEGNPLPCGDEPVRIKWQVYPEEPFADLPF